MTKDELIHTYIKKHDLTRFFSKNKMPKFELIDFKKGDILLKEYQISNYLYFVVQGTVKIFTYSSQGKILYIKQFVEPFHILGETASLWGWPPVANVKASTDVTCLAVSLPLYRNQLFEDTVFLRYIGKQMAESIQKGHTLFMSMLHSNLSERLAHFLINNAHHNVFSLNLTETAEFLGTSYRHLFRCLNELYDTGALERVGRKIKISDPEQLIKLSKDLQ